MPWFPAWGIKFDKEIEDVKETDVPQKEITTTEAPTLASTTPLVTLGK